MARERAYRSIVRGAWLWNTLAACALFGAGAWLMFAGRGSAWLAGSLVVVGGMIGGLGTWSRLRAIARIHEFQRRACLNCLYDLRPMGSHGICPECGEAFNIQRTVDRWLDAIAELTPDGSDENDED